MTFKGLKQIVYQSLNKHLYKNTDNEKNNVNKIITGVLLYKTLEQLMSSSNNYKDDIKETADQYALTFKNMSESMEKKFISYKEISKKIKSYKLINFLGITQNQINELYLIYQNKTEIKEFSCFEFSKFMYNVGNITDRENKSLNSIHFKIMVPVVQYYMTYYNIQTKDVTVEDVGTTAGREVKISISNVECNQIFNDINRDVMNVKKYIQNFNITSDDFVKILIK